jgi:hypothetical protein
MVVWVRMKTTVEIADALLADAKRTASEEGSTLRDLIEEGLRRSIDDRRRRGAFRLRRASFKGKGLRADVEPGTWERIREMAYEGRGS